MSTTAGAPADSSVKPSDNKIIIPKLDNLTKQEKAVIEYIKVNKRFAIKDIEVLFGIKESRARRIINGLLEKNLIVKKGKRKSHYFVLPERS